MKTLQCKTVAGWIDWLDSEGLMLAKEERDIRLTTHMNCIYIGSVQSVSVVQGKITLCTYGNKEVCVAVDAAHIASIQIFNSRRLRPDTAYRQMVEMEKILKPNPPLNIDDTCP